MGPVGVSLGLVAVISATVESGLSDEPMLIYDTKYNHQRRMGCLLERTKLKIVYTGNDVFRGWFGVYNSSTAAKRSNDM